MLAEVIGLLAPPRCGACAAVCPPRAVLCGGCEADLRELRPRTVTAPGVDAAWAAAPYDGIARELVVGLKFGRRLSLAGPIAEALAAALPPDLDGALVPVPADPARRRRRGFDAAEEIARALGARLGLEVRFCLRRTSGRRQVGRPRIERVAEAPQVRGVGEVPPRAVLVDDVRTTGATLGACAAGLRAGGAHWVGALTFAAAEPGAGP